MSDVNCKQKARWIVARWDSNQSAVCDEHLAFACRALQRGVHISTELTVRPLHLSTENTCMCGCHDCV